MAMLDSEGLEEGTGWRDSNWFICSWLTSMIYGAISLFFSHKGHFVISRSECKVMFSKKKKTQKELTVCLKWQLPNMYKSKAFSTISEVSLIPYYKQLVLANIAGVGRHWDGNSGSTLYYFLSSKSTMSGLEATSCLWLLFSSALLENNCFVTRNIIWGNIFHYFQSCQCYPAFLQRKL